MITQTGNAEIDQQHQILEDMVAHLETFCPEPNQPAASSCDRCGLAMQQQCRATLAAMATKLGAFLVGHATYEERMMELLPDTPTCRAHVKAHKAAHQGVDRQLKRLAARIAEESPKAASAHVWQVIGDWLGDHTALFDRRLVRMSRAAAPEIDFDGELVAMLDQYVFPNRPTAAKSPPAPALPQQKRKMEVRGRFESLSPAQRSVFWLVVGGKRNAEIGDSLGITVNTVKTHRAAIYQKMDVRSVIELVRMTDLLR